MTQYQNSASFAMALDEADPLKSYRSKFYIPQKNGKDLIYFCGNSLGLHPKSVRDHINHIVSRMTTVELKMFEGGGRKTVASISNINREFLHLKSALANQEEPLRHFFEMLAKNKILGDSSNERTEHILSEQEQVMRFIETHHAIALELRETNVALLELRQNEIMTLLTVVIFGVEVITLAFSLHLIF